MNNALMDFFAMKPFLEWDAARRKDGVQADASRYGAGQSTLQTMLQANAARDVAQTNAASSNFGSLANLAGNYGQSYLGNDASKYGVQQGAMANMFGSLANADASKYGAQQGANAQQNSAFYGAVGNTNQGYYGAQAARDQAQGNVYAANQQAQAMQNIAPYQPYSQMYGADAAANSGRDIALSQALSNYRTAQLEDERKRQSLNAILGLVGMMSGQQNSAGAPSFTTNYGGGFA